MRLFLSSYRAGRHDDKLVQLLGKKTKLAVITNAKDYKTPEEREIKVKDFFAYLSSIGLKPEELDLRKYFTSQVNLEKEVRKYQAIWLAGGNAFLLRRALKQTGLDRLLYDMVRKNEIIYGGESAGAIIAGPTLRGSEVEDKDEDSPHFIVEGYDKEILWDGLDFVSYVPVPHYKSADVGEEIEQYIEYLQNEGLLYKTMTDDQAIVIDGDKEEFLK